jgi:hypothetical protein
MVSLVKYFPLPLKRLFWVCWKANVYLTFILYWIATSL